MRKKNNALFLFLLVVASEVGFAKEIIKKNLHDVTKKQNTNKEKPNIERVKRSLDDKEDKPFWGNRGKKKIESLSSSNRYDNNAEKPTTVIKRGSYVEKEPFWGMRGRRDSSSAENYIDNKHSEYLNDPYNCKNCYGTIHFDDNNYKDRREDNLAPFWGNRGRRSSNEIDDDPFWGNRGRRQDNEPFWGTRGRRKESPFWGARGRREDEPFWGNRGRRDDEPFWGNRGRRQDSEPFWGNRGRRQDSDLFWGNRARSDDEPFWGNRGRRRETEPFWGNRGRRKDDLKDSIMDAIDLVENDIEHLSRLRRSESSFWTNRGRESKLKNMFSAPPRNRLTPKQMGREFSMNLKIDPSTVHDSRIFAEEPHYIVVERSSRSSAETEDPFFISRGKKYYLNYNLIKAARDRRGAIEEIVKSVRNDPYYIARGKKDMDQPGIQKDDNSTSDEEYQRAKELVCSAIDMIAVQHNNGKIKREIDSDRDRRTILKKLAAQLQIDPYYVSRGKKSDNSNGNLREFITEIAEKCE